MANYIDPADQKTELDANDPPASMRQSIIKIPVVFGKSRTRGNSVGAMIDDMHGEHADLRDLLSREARDVGIEPSVDYVTQGVSRVLRLYEEAHAAWLKSKGDTVGHVLEVELPSGQKLLMGSRQTLYRYEFLPAQERSHYDCPSP